MNADNCAEIANAKRVEQKSGLSEPLGHRHEGFIVPAGILIGMGAGILADHIVPGFLVGFGIGLVLAELACIAADREHGSPHSGANMTPVLIGSFMVLIGVSLVVAPAIIWPYAVAGFFIIAGIGILIRGVTART